MMKPFLPPEPVDKSSSAPRSNLRLAKQRNGQPQRLKASHIRTFLHVFIYTTIHFVFSIFFRFRRAWRLSSYKVRGVLRHHHHTPEWIVNDVKNLEQLPKHLSVILDHHEDDEDQGNAGLEGLVNDVCEIAAWTASAGIPFLSIYERTGTQRTTSRISTANTS